MMLHDDVTTHGFVQELWDLCGLSGSSLSFNDEDLVFFDGVEEVFAERPDRKRATRLLNRHLFPLGW